MSYEFREDVPSHLMIEHITCPAKWCGSRHTPTCEKECDSYREFRERLIELAAEVFP